MMRIACTLLFLFLSNHTGAQSKYQKDFDFYWQTINDDFGYFDTQHIDWAKVKTIYQPLADTITTRTGFIHLLETVNNELYNGHISLNTNLQESYRLIPTGSDMWVVHTGRQYIISAIRTGYNADLCGLKRGMLITMLNGIPIDSAVQHMLPRSVQKYDNRMYEYAVNLLLAGTHNGKRKIAVLVNGVERLYNPDSISNRSDTSYSALLEQRKATGSIGYIRVLNSLGNNDLIKVFDSALDSLWNTKGLIIDLRETPSGGNAIVARAIMSRFIEKEMPYQKHILPAEEKQSGVKRTWVEYVSPRGRIYTGPVVILVNRWTGSMGEGIAIGFDGMKRATIVGDNMAGLLGAIYSYTMPETGIGFSIPVEQLYHINGTPRENFVPQYLEMDDVKAMAKAIQLLNR